jgi:hypothetical protein
MSGAAWLAYIHTIGRNAGFGLPSFADSLAFFGQREKSCGGRGRLRRIALSPAWKKIHPACVGGSRAATADFQTAFNRPSRPNLVNLGK